MALASLDGLTPESLRRLLTTYGLLVVPVRAQVGDDDLPALLRTARGTGPAVVGIRTRAGPEREAPRFSDQHRAFETLPADVRDWLIGRRVRWPVAAGAGAGAARVAAQPIFRRHPLNGRVALHLPPPGRAASISGLPDDVAATTIAHLAEHAGRDESLLSVTLTDGDVVLWDSWSVRHVPASGPASYAVPWS